MVHSTTNNASSHDSILELWRSLPNDRLHEISQSLTGLDPEGLFTGEGGGHLKPRRLEASGASRELGEIMRGGGTPTPLLIGRGAGSPGDLPRIFVKIYVSENAFQAILKPFFHIL